MRITRAALTDNFFRPHNPLHDAAELATVEWAAGLSLFRDEHAHEAFVDARITLLTAMIYPDANLDDLILCNGWLIWFFIVDAQSAERDHCYATLDFHTGRRATTPPASSVPASRAFDDLCARTFPRMSTTLARRFADNTRETIEAMSEDADLKLTRIIPEVEECTRIRREDGGTHLLADLLEFTESTEIPAPLLDDYQRLRDGLADICLWPNDMMTVDLEEQNGETVNMVFSVQQRDACTREQALETVRLMTRERIQDQEALEQRFLTLIETLGLRR